MVVALVGDRAVKAADTERDRERLGREAAVLRAAAHPGVVNLVAAEGGEPPRRLVLSRVGGGSLRERGPDPREVTAGWAAAVATTLADLHQIGYVHGAVDPDHILFDLEGRPVLCGFGAAAPVVDARTRAEGAARDTAALAAIVRPRLAGLDRRLDGALARIATGKARRGCDARSLSRLLVEKVPAARLQPSATQPREAATSLPVAQSPEANSRRISTRRPAAGHGRRRLVVGGGAAGLAAALIGLAVLRLGASSAGGSAAPGGGGGEKGGVVTVGTYRVVPSPGEELVALIGRWGCGPTGPAVLDLRSGAVWTYGGRLEPGREEPGRLKAVVDQAAGLAVRRGTGACDDLLVLRRHGLQPAVLHLAGP